MPTKSKRQARLMKAACANEEFAKRLGIPQSVACDFVRADKRKKLKLTKRSQR